MEAKQKWWPPPLIPKTVEFQEKWLWISPFGHNIAGGSGARRINEPHNCLRINLTSSLSGLSPKILVTGIELQHFFNIRVTQLTLGVTKTSQRLLSSKNKGRRRRGWKCQQRVLDVEIGTFTPLGFNVITMSTIDEISNSEGIKARARYGASWVRKLVIYASEKFW